MSILSVKDINTECFQDIYIDKEFLPDYYQRFDFRQTTKTKIELFIKLYIINTGEYINEQWYGSIEVLQDNTTDTLYTAMNLEDEQQFSSKKDAILFAFGKSPADYGLTTLYRV